MSRDARATSFTVVDARTWSCGPCLKGLFVFRAVFLHQKMRVFVVRHRVIPRTCSGLGFYEPAVMQKSLTGAGLLGCPSLTPMRHCVGTGLLPLLCELHV